MKDITKFGPILLIVILLLPTRNLFGHTKSEPYIKGVVNGNHMKVSHIQIAYGDVENFDSDMSNLRFVRTTLDSNGGFIFKFSGVKTIQKVSFGIVYRQPNSTSVIRNFVMIPTDKLHMNIEITDDENIKQIVFEGAGAEKYTCRWAIEGIFVSKFKKDKANYGTKLLDPNNFKEINELCRSNLEILIDTLSTYKRQLPTYIYDLLFADMYGDVYQEFNSIYTVAWERNNPSFNKLIKDFYEKNKWELPRFNDATVRLSLPYLKALFKKVEIESLMENAIFDRFKLSPSEIFKQIKFNFEGHTRERLLMFMICDLKNQAIFDNSADSVGSFLSNVLREINDPEITSIIKESKIYKTPKGRKAYNFLLPDLSGKKISLSDFKGKVVLMDMWFTGCTGCAITWKKLAKDVLPNFINNSNFEVVSIGTDLSKDKWHKGINSGNYTDTTHLNLHMPLGNSNWAENEMIQYYGLIGLPFVLLIDKTGKIIKNITFLQDSDELIGVIKNEIFKVL